MPYIEPGPRNKLQDNKIHGSGWQGPLDEYVPNTRGVNSTSMFSVTGSVIILELDSTCLWAVPGH